MARKDNNLVLEKNGDILVISMNRPKQRNSLNVEMVRNLREAFESIRWDESVKVVILSGKGEKSFCAGLDLKERSRMSEEEILNSRERDIIPLFHYLGEFPKPIIAAINGVALGGGAELALVCDMRLATPHARFGQTEIRWGMIPSAGGCQRLRLITGMAVAKELIMSGRVIEAEEALRLGLELARIAQEESVVQVDVRRDRGQDQKGRRVSARESISESREPARHGGIITASTRKRPSSSA